MLELIRHHLLEVEVEEEINDVAAPGNYPSSSTFVKGYLPV